MTAPLLLLSCGLSVQPTRPMDTPAAGRLPPGMDEPAIASPRPAQSGAGTRRVCRSGSRPRGWIAVRYEQDAKSCPKQVAEDNPYTVAELVQYEGRAVGSTLVVCADQRLPGGWLRTGEAVEGDGCPGARVSAGAPTAFVMRRIE